MRLKELVRVFEVNLTGEQQQMQIDGIAYDSRKVAEGYVFVAIKGYSQDGHEYIRTAIRQGAVVIIHEAHDGIPLYKADYGNVVFIQVEDSRKALAVVSSTFYDNPSSDLLLIGVTGTNGKTSITHMLANMYEARNEKTGVIGTIGNRIGDKHYKASNTTPESLELQQLFSSMRDEGVDVCLMEVSSHSLKLNRVHGADFDVAIFTNLTEDHLDFHKDMEDYYLSKSKLFKMAAAGSAINIDDPYGERLCRELSAQGYNFMTYGLDRHADVHASNIDLRLDHTQFDLVTPEFVTRVRISMPGKIYVYNLLAAVTSLLIQDWSREDIDSAIRSLQPIRGRMEQIPNNMGATVIVDYAHTPDALEKVIQTVREFTKGKVHVVFGCGGNRDKTKRPIMGAIAKSLSDIAYVTSDNPRMEDPDAIIRDIQEGMTTGDTEVVVESDRRKAIRMAIARLSKGDTLVIAGKGHETYQIIGTETLPFDDREEAKLALDEK